MAEQEGPKLIVDTDWKAQAQAEKERLAEKERAKAPAKGPAAPGAPAGEEDYGPVQANFAELVRMLATQAMMYLGAFPDPETGKRMVALEAAQFNIELLGILEEKTKGNLTEEEKTMLTRLLYELRMQYVEIAKAVAKAVEQGRLTPGGGGPGAPVVPDININPGRKG
jgi:hypothetical protein